MLGGEAANSYSGCYGTAGYRERREKHSSSEKRQLCMYIHVPQLVEVI